MLRRDDFQLCAMALVFALLMNTCGWVIGQAFVAWSEKFDHNEVALVQLPYSPVTPVEVVRELTDEQRVQRCKRSGECSKMAEALVYEARGETLQGSIAVGYVIVERTKNPTRWPKTVRGVIAQKAQFSYTTKRQKVKPKPEDWERAYITGYQVLHGEVENPIGNADHYHTLKVKPKWARHMQYIATVGSHKFYREQE